ncbi:MAG: glycosyltransferase family 87 protein [Terracidiphilus sp.]
MSFQKILSFLLILFAGGMLFAAGFIASSALRVQDLAQYWAGAHLIRENPYSETLVTDFERSFGYSLQAPAMVMRNPPSALALILPFRYMSYNIAFAFWMLVSVIVVASCARVSSSLSGNSEPLAPAFLCLLYGPTVALLMVGQITVLVLLGVTLFLVLSERKRDWLAGAFLSLTFVKPHVILLFLIAILLWSIKAKRWAILLSFGLSLAVTSVFVLILNPHIFLQYIAFARQFAGETTPYPNVGGMLYVVSGYRGLAFFPQVAGLVWLALYWRRHRSNWDWKAHGMVVLLVSVACSYYSFPFDQIVVLPALMAAFANGNRRIFLGAFVVTNLGYALYISNISGRFGFGYMFLWWTASAWLVTYLICLNSRWGNQTKTATFEQCS